jgi:hypothetical protein
MILQSFTKNGIPFNPLLTLQHLSPSFYQPTCLAEMSLGHLDLDLLLAQFNYFPAWTRLPQYEQPCLHHLASSTDKKEFLLLVKSQLNLGKIPSAISILETCSKFNWADTHRYHYP